MAESKALDFKEKVAQLTKSPTSPSANQEDPAGFRIPKPFKKT